MKKIQHLTARQFEDLYHKYSLVDGNKYIFNDNVIKAYGKLFAVNYKNDELMTSKQTANLLRKAFGKCTCRYFGFVMYYNWCFEFDKNKYFILTYGFEGDGFRTQITPSMTKKDLIQCIDWCVNKIMESKNV